MRAVSIIAISAVIAAASFSPGRVLAHGVAVATGHSAIDGIIAVLSPLIVIGIVWAVIELRLELRRRKDRRDGRK
jgi:hypothetical protein